MKTYELELSRGAVNLLEYLVKAHLFESNHCWDEANELLDEATRVIRSFEDDPE